MIPAWKLAAASMTHCMTHHHHHQITKLSHSINAIMTHCMTLAMSGETVPDSIMLTRCHLQLQWRT
jgi:hypothetical protein